MKKKFTLNHVKEATMMAGEDKGIDYLIKMFDNNRYDEIEGENPKLELLKEKLWAVKLAKDEASLVYGQLEKEAEQQPLKVGRAKNV